MTSSISSFVVDGKLPVLSLKDLKSVTRSNKTREKRMSKINGKVSQAKLKYKSDCKSINLSYEEQKIKAKKEYEKKIKELELSKKESLTRLKNEYKIKRNDVYNNWQVIKYKYEEKVNKLIAPLLNILELLYSSKIISSTPRTFEKSNAVCTKDTASMTTSTDVNSKVSKETLLNHGDIENKKRYVAAFVNCDLSLWLKDESINCINPKLVVPAYTSAFIMSEKDQVYNWEFDIKNAKVTIDGNEVLLWNNEFINCDLLEYEYEDLLDGLIDNIEDKKTINIDYDYYRKEGKLQIHSLWLFAWDNHPTIN